VRTLISLDIRAARAATGRGDRWERRSALPADSKPHPFCALGRRGVPFYRGLSLLQRDPFHYRAHPAHQQCVPVPTPRALRAVGAHQRRDVRCRGDSIATSRPFCAPMSRSWPDAPLLCHRHLLYRLALDPLPCCRTRPVRHRARLLTSSGHHVMGGRCPGTPALWKDGLRIRFPPAAVCPAPSPRQHGTRVAGRASSASGDRGEQRHSRAAPVRCGVPLPPPSPDPVVTGHPGQKQ